MQRAIVVFVLAFAALHNLPSANAEDLSEEELYERIKKAVRPLKQNGMRKETIFSEMHQKLMDKVSFLPGHIEKTCDDLKEIVSGIQSNSRQHANKATSIATRLQQFIHNMELLSKCPSNTLSVDGDWQTNRHDANAMEVSTFDIPQLVQPTHSVNEESDNFKDLFSLLNRKSEGLEAIKAEIVQQYESDARVPVKVFMKVLSLIGENFQTRKLSVLENKMAYFQKAKADIEDTAHHAGIVDETVHKLGAMVDNYHVNMMEAMNDGIQGVRENVQLVVCQ